MNSMKIPPIPCIVNIVAPSGSSHNHSQPPHPFPPRKPFHPKTKMRESNNSLSSKIICNLFTEPSSMRLIFISYYIVFCVYCPSYAQSKSLKTKSKIHLKFVYCKIIFKIRYIFKNWLWKNCVPGSSGWNLDHLAGCPKAQVGPLDGAQYPQSRSHSSLITGQ